ncbi:MAG: hypothetical protein HYR94_01230 [Chloroflexi bacterium]|nr:hypothetical protein [Chloroflexota bacterium]
MVKIDNSWLKVANSKNYHHFFPRAYLRKQGYENWQTNSILNITIVDDYLNKRRIQANAPSQYMKEFLKNNPDLEKTMKTHLIDDLKTFGVFGSFGRGDNYEQFLEKRGERILRELNKRLYPTL